MITLGKKNYFILQNLIGTTIKTIFFVLRKRMVLSDKKLRGGLWTVETKVGKCKKEKQKDAIIRK